MSSCDTVDPIGFSHPPDGQSFKREFVRLVKHQEAIIPRREQHCVSAIGSDEGLRFVYPWSGDETRGAAGQANGIASFAAARPEEGKSGVVIDYKGTVSDERLVLVTGLFVAKGPCPWRLRGSE